MNKTELAKLVIAKVIPLGDGVDYIEPEKIAEKLPDGVTPVIHGGGLTIITPEGLAEADRIRKEAARSNLSRFSEQLAVGGALALIFGLTAVGTCWACRKIAQNMPIQGEPQ